MDGQHPPTTRNPVYKIGVLARRMLVYHLTTTKPCKKQCKNRVKKLLAPDHEHVDFTTTYKYINLAKPTFGFKKLVSALREKVQDKKQKRNPCLSNAKTKKQKIKNRRPCLSKTKNNNPKKNKLICCLGFALILFCFLFLRLCWSDFLIFLLNNQQRSCEELASYYIT
jgi:hypothetical protein